jgi:excinuclease UvrABC nuclease subunit
VLSPVLLSNTPNDCGAYIIFLKEHDMIKVGKAKNFYARVNQLRNQYGEILPIHLFTFDNEEDAYMMEIVLHKYYKEKYPNSQFIPQDRFAKAGCSLADIEILSQAARKIKQTNWF